MAHQPVIRVDAIRKTYGRTAAVDDVSFEVRPGEIFGLIGPNGAGKTTTMECVEGLRRPDRGAISVLGLDPTRDVYALQERIGVQLQQAQLQKRIKVREAVFFWASLYRKPVDGDRLIEQLGLGEKRNAWFMTLSGGQKQRLFIALALINDPELVFLDELTTGLDPQARRAIWDLMRGIRQRGKTVFLTTHLMEEAERLCDRVAIIDHGRIVDIGAPADLVRRHCPERTAIVTTEDVTAAERFRAIPQVQSVTSQGLHLTIRGSGDDLPTTILTAHVLVKLIFTAVTLVVMVLAGRRYHVVDAAVPLASFALAVLFSTVSIVSLGFLIASIVPTARFAQPLGTLILYPMLGVSGLFVPIESLPPMVQAEPMKARLNY